MSCITILRQLQCHLVMRNDNDEYELAMTHLMTAIVISGAMMVQLRNVRGAMMMLEGRLRIKYFGFRSDSNLVIRPCCPSHPDSLLRVFTSVLISTHSLTTTRFSYFPARNSMSHIFHTSLPFSFQFCFLANANNSGQSFLTYHSVVSRNIFVILTTQMHTDRKANSWIQIGIFIYT